MTLRYSNKDSAKTLAERIFLAHQGGRTYREISAQDYPGVKAGTLNRIAKSGGAWMPKNKVILAALGFGKRKSIPEWVKPIKKRIAMMRRETQNAIESAFSPK